MQLVTNALLLLAASVTATAFTNQHDHQQPHLYRHLGRANTTSVNPNLGVSDQDKPAHADYAGCDSVNAVNNPSPPPPPPPHPPLAVAPGPGPGVRVLPTGTGTGVVPTGVVPTGGVKPTPFVFVSGAVGGYAAAAAAAAAAGCLGGVGVVVAVLL
ncbi:uncharacterized protein B0H64DRAFT_476205 [Chaetomium fimeti]|uniref:Uncharacterized protein n=1 Tax=Chaetomium fimeti TaxID=1854472 RepID=A0AAE0LR57_9PEZI|nr:hypothetical protein B0H64DRAFT_476205 [Chaetomium fimeti]